MQLSLLQAQAMIGTPQFPGSPIFGMKNLPTKISYRFTKLAKKIQNEFKDFDEERQKLIE